MNFTADDIAQLVLLIGSISAAAVAIIKALKENTAAVVKGNEQTAVADVRKIALSETIAQPFVNSAAPGVATVAADPLEARIRRIEEALAGKVDTET